MNFIVKCDCGCLRELEITSNEHCTDLIVMSVDCATIWLAPKQAKQIAQHLNQLAEEIDD